MTDMRVCLMTVIAAMAVGGAFALIPGDASAGASCDGHHHRCGHRDRDRNDHNRDRDHHRDDDRRGDEGDCSRVILAACHNEGPGSGLNLPIQVIPGASTTTTGMR